MKTKKNSIAAKSLVAVLLAGGLGTRLRPLTLNIPKPLVEVNGVPFLGHLLDKLASDGIKEIVMLTGYKSKMIEKYCGSGKKWGLSIKYSVEKTPLGTGGAIVKASGKISKTALVLNGDTYADLDISKFASYHRQKKATATLYAMHGTLKERGKIVAGANGKVRQFLEKQSSGYGLFNTGTYIIEPSAIKRLAALVKNGSMPKAFSMEKDAFPIFASQGGMYAYRGNGRFIDIGTFKALSQADEVVGGNSRKSISVKKGTGAIFLDRDGVINKNRDTYVTHPDQFELEEGAFEGLQALSKLGMPLFVVTNQSIIGRKLVSHQTLQQIHDKMLGHFTHAGVKITEVFFCPHDPHAGCMCRKPEIGMLVQAQKKYGVDLARSFVIGDSTGDILMGNTAGCTTILLETGYGGRDGRHNATPSHVCKNLLHAAEAIKKELAKKR